MNFRKHAFILAVIESLRRQGSWTGKTHVQKTLSILRDSGMVQVPFDFVLYKHGPYSFDVEAELEQMQSYGAIAVDPNPEGYGVTLEPATMAEFVGGMESLSENETKAIDDVCSFIGTRNVTELERLATASWIRQHEGKVNPDDVAKRLNALKPHISVAEAVRADAEVSTWLSQVR